MSTDNPRREYVFSSDRKAAEVMAIRRVRRDAAFLLPF